MNLFVIKVVPMLNPDGVARGHFRLDTLDQNLNRYYENPDPERQPAIYAVKKVIAQIEKDYLPSKIYLPLLASRARREVPQPGQLYLYLDLHAHATKQGAFIYGNHFEDFED